MRVNERDRRLDNTERYRTLLLKAWVGSATQEGALLSRLSAELTTVADTLRDKTLASEINVIAAHLTGILHKSQKSQLKFIESR